jgi:hypothetical protein
MGHQVAAKKTWEEGESAEWTGSLEWRGADREVILRAAV